MADAPRLLTERHDRVLVVRFHNPPRNFFDEAMGIELAELVEEVDRDRSLGAVVLTGDERWVTHFSVPDLLRGARGAPFPVSFAQARSYAAFARLLGRSARVERALRTTRLRGALTLPRIYRTVARMNESDKVYVAAVNGLALGMGAILALQCDLRLMAAGDDHRFGLIETAISVLAAAGGTQRLVRMVGQSRAAELLLEGRWLTPDEAAELGLVHRVVAPEELEREALAVAERVAARSPVLNREIKRMLYDAGTRPAAAAYRMEGASMVTTMSAPRPREEMETYLDKLRRHDAPSDRDLLEAWAEMLAVPAP
jgi:enoyl-CoA hydratase/carnithine racemase